MAQAWRKDAGSRNREEGFAGNPSGQMMVQQKMYAVGISDPYHGTQGEGSSHIAPTIPRGIFHERQHGTPTMRSDTSARQGQATS